VSERRLLQLRDLARRTRARDLLFAFLALGAGLAAALAFGGIGWRGGFLVAAGAGVVLLARYFWGGRALATTDDLTQAPPQGLSLATAEALVERLPEPLLVLDSEGRILFSNSASYSLLGSSGVRRHISAVLRAPGVLEAVRLVLGGSGAQRVEYSIPVPVERHMLAYVAPIPLRVGDNGAEGPGAIIVLHELTAQKRLEQMRVDFVANASHELRTPLASLSGYIDTLRGHARDDAVARERFLEIMGEQAGRMRRLIEDLLSLSRIELNEHVRPEHAVDLGGVVRDVLDALAPQVAARGVELEVEIAPDLPPVAGERDELIQVVQNLVDNALKYGGGRVVIRAGAAAPSDADVRHGRANFVAVQDFGDGIARAHLPRLTERFYRVDVQRSRQTGGTGLGLAIVKHIVNRHRGWMSIESQLGEGSTFTVFLPWAEGGEQPARRSAPSETAA